MLIHCSCRIRARSSARGWPCSSRSGELTEVRSKAVYVTLMIGFVMASTIGIIVGLADRPLSKVEAATDWLVNALYATPLIAIIPLVILWFGLGDAAKLFIVTILAVFPVLINTAAGVRNVPARADRCRQCFRGERAASVHQRSYCPRRCPT